MSSLKFDRFTKPAFLRQIGRPHLDAFLARFSAELALRRLNLPGPGADDYQYFTLLAHTMMAPEGLPEAMSEALYAINGMATAEGQQRLESAVAERGLPITFAPESSPGDIALQVWLATPALLARIHNEHRL